MLHDNIEYPDDKSLRTKLDAIPKFKSFMMNTICALREKYIAVEFVGNVIRIMYYRLLSPRITSTTGYY